MKLFLLAALATVAIAAPQFENVGPVINVLRDDRVDNGDGNFQYQFEADNGISVNAVGTPGSLGQSNMEGSYRFILDDGTEAVVTWVADENGYRAESPLLPAQPAHVAELLQIAQEQRASGITFDQQGHRV